MSNSNYSMTCSCGHELSADASSHEEAVSKLQSTMDETAIEAHFRESHPGESVPAVSDVHGMIAENLELSMA